MFSRTLVLLLRVWIYTVGLLHVTEACIFGPGCIYPCHCDDPNEACDPNTGVCLISGCEDGDRNGNYFTGAFTGYGCQIGNVAYSKPASQGVDTSGVNSASLAVNGNINQVLSNDNCAHPISNDGVTPAWWQVDLETDHVITSVTIYNRVDQPKKRLASTHVEVYNSDIAAYTTCKYIGPDQIDIDVITVACANPLKGQIVRLRRNFDAYEKHLINVCEVMVIGYVYHPCPDGFYGAVCQTQCTCQPRCDDVTGLCALPSMAGSTGPSYISSTPISLTLSFNAWSPSTGGGGTPTDYQPQYRTVGAATWTSASLISHTDASTYDFTVDGLRSGTSYQFQVVPVIQDGGQIYPGTPTPTLTYSTQGTTTTTSTTTTSTTTTTAPAASPSSSSPGVSAGDVGPATEGGPADPPIAIIAGVLVPILLLLAIAGAIILFFWRRKRKRVDDHESKALHLESGRGENGVRAYENSAFAGRGETDEVITKSEKTAPTLTAKPAQPPKPSSPNRTPKLEKSPKSSRPDVIPNRPVVPVKPLNLSAGGSSKPEVVPRRPETPFEEEEDDEDIPSPEEGVLYDNIYKNVSLLSNVILVENLQTFVEKRKANISEYEKEYKKLPAGKTAEWRAAMRPENKNKNRFKNIHAYDHSRVLLEVGEGEDYINACFMPSYDEKCDDPHGYIASQGPKDNTVVDMWRMIWQYRINRIVMVTNLVEAGRDKCYRYWPEEGKAKHGDFSVTLVGTENFAEYVIRHLNLQYEGSNRTLFQLHYTGWPDHGVPTEASSLLDFRRKVRSYDKVKSGPLLVHCSAGIGRTGTFITIDYQLEKAKAEGKLDILHYASILRDNRVNMIQAKAQYLYLHDAILEALLSGETSMPAHTMKDVYASLIQSPADGAKSKLDQQYEVLEALNPAHVIVAGSLPCNMSKNRDASVLPFENARPFLRIPVEGTSDYINAVYCRGFRRRMAYIATQMPLAATIPDIWRLMHDHDSRTIVMLSQTDDQTMPVYWPQSKDEPLEFGKLVASLEEEETPTSDENVTSRRFSLLETGKDEEDEIKQFCLKGWSDDADIPPSTDSILCLLDEVERWQEQSGNRAIVVMCKNGARHTGLVIAASFLLDKIKIDQEVDVFTSVKQIRLARPQLIQNMEQYKYLHELALEFMAKHDTYANFK